MIDIYHYNKGSQPQSLALLAPQINKIYFAASVVVTAEVLRQLPSQIHTLYFPQKSRFYIEALRALPPSVSTIMFGHLARKNFYQLLTMAPGTLQKIIIKDMEYNRQESLAFLIAKQEIVPINAKVVESTSSATQKQKPTIVLKKNDNSLVVNQIRTLNNKKTFSEFDAVKLTEEERSSEDFFDKVEVVPGVFAFKPIYEPPFTSLFSQTNGLFDDVAASSSSNPAATCIAAASELQIVDDILSIEDGSAPIGSQPLYGSLTTAPSPFMFFAHQIQFDARNPFDMMPLDESDCFGASFAIYNENIDDDDCTLPNAK